MGTIKGRFTPGDSDSATRRLGTSRPKWGAVAIARCERSVAVDTNRAIGSSNYGPSRPILGDSPNFGRLDQSPSRPVARKLFLTQKLFLALLSRPTCVAQNNGNFPLFGRRRLWRLQNGTHFSRIPWIVFCAKCNNGLIIIHHHMPPPCFFK